MIHPLFSEKKDQRQPETRRDDPPTPCLCEEASEEVPGEPRPYHVRFDVSMPPLAYGSWIDYATEECVDYKNCERRHTWLRREPGERA